MSYLKKREMDFQQRKIKALKIQLYGQEASTYAISALPSSSQASSQIQSSDKYLAGDLTKSLILASIIVLAQALIFFGNVDGLVKL